MGSRKMGVLIGGSGLIGGTVVNYFKVRYPDVFDIRAPSSKKLSLQVESDICRYMMDVRPDFIINTAMAGLGASGQLSYEVNYRGVVNLARAANGLGIPFLHLSSAAMLPSGFDLREEDIMPLSAHMSNYAKSKLMAEMTLQEMARREGLDFTCIRLGVVYGAHDHKVQGFHRMLFSIVDESMPALLTKKNTLHSYSNSRKLPFLLHHMLENREEFSGGIYHFVDPQPVDLATLILTIRSYLGLKKPRKIYVPFWVAERGQKLLRALLNLLRGIGVKGDLPPELMFLDNFYLPQTLNSAKLQNSSFIDPMPEETVFSRLPELIAYYLTRWSHTGQVTTFDEGYEPLDSVETLFRDDPQALVNEMHARGLEPYDRMCLLASPPFSDS